MPDITVHTQIQNLYGFHARPSTQFAMTAKKYTCAVEVSLVDDDYVVDGKSVMDLLTLAALVGSKIQIRCIGDDAKEAAEALKHVVDSRFGGID